jgi:hypothetical protein
VQGGVLSFFLPASALLLRGLGGVFGCFIPLLFLRLGFFVVPHNETCLFEISMLSAFWGEVFGIYDFQGPHIFESRTLGWAKNGELCFGFDDIPGILASIILPGIVGTAYIFPILYDITLLFTFVMGASALLGSSKINILKSSHFGLTTSLLSYFWGGGLFDEL